MPVYDSACSGISKEYPGCTSAAFACKKRWRAELKRRYNSPLWFLMKLKAVYLLCLDVSSLPLHFFSNPLQKLSEELQRFLKHDTLQRNTLDHMREHPEPLVFVGFTGQNLLYRAKDHVASESPNHEEIYVEFLGNVSG